MEAPYQKSIIITQFEFAIVAFGSNFSTRVKIFYMCKTVYTRRDVDFKKNYTCKSFARVQILNVAIEKNLEKSVGHKNQNDPKQSENVKNLF